MNGAISIEIIIGLGIVCGTIVGGVTWVRSQAKDLVAVHNENAQAHEDMREEIGTIHKRFDEHERRFEEYISSHEKFVGKKTEEIIEAIRESRQ